MNNPIARPGLLDQSSDPNMEAIPKGTTMTAKLRCEPPTHPWNPEPNGDDHAP